MNTTAKIKAFEAPETMVRFNNLQVDTTKKTFTVTLGTKTKAQRQWRDQEVSGTVTSELSDFFALKRDVKIKVMQGEVEKWIPTGEKLTSFEKYLLKREVEFYPNILKDMSFECDNMSAEYAPCPFKLVRLAERNIMSLVNIASKKRTELFDHTTGLTKAIYNNRYYDSGNGMRRSFVAPQFYRRLIVETTADVTMAAAS